jgi:ATP-dependent Clp protease ATP-binding subunit ClpC
VFERFTDEARRVVVLSQEESRLLHHTYIGTEHVLLALVADPASATSGILGGVGITTRRIRHELLDIVGHGSQPSPGHIPFTPQAKHVIELAVRAALELRDELVEPPHIFLGVLGEERGLAARILVTLGGELGDLRQEAVVALGQTEQQRGWTP